MVVSVAAVIGIAAATVSEDEGGDGDLLSPLRSAAADASAAVVAVRCSLLSESPFALSAAFSLSRCVRGFIGQRLFADWRRCHSVKARS